MRGIVSAVIFTAATVLQAAGAAAEPAGCAAPNALGVGRTVEIDTANGPGFGMEHYKAYDFLQPKEVVLTFDDGPQKFSTESVLAALAAECTKATFFSIGKMALGYPEIIRTVANAGHTVGSHTWSHQAISKLKTFDEGRDEIERGLSAVKRAVGGPIAPFFRYPTLKDTPESLAYLGKRNIAMFSTDIDSFDFKLQPPEALVKGVMDKLDKKGKGIVLMHDIHKNTAKALPLLLTALKTKGYKVVHLKPKDQALSLAEYDSAIEKDAKGLPQIGAERPTASVVRTIDGTAPATEAAASSVAPVKPVTETQAAVPAAAAPAPEKNSVPETTAAVPPASPVTTVGTQVTTSSITNKTSADPAPQKPEGAASAAVPAKSLSEKAKDIWQLWFGK